VRLATSMPSAGRRASSASTTAAGPPPGAAPASWTGRYSAPRAAAAAPPPRRLRGCAPVGSTRRSWTTCTQPLAKARAGIDVLP
jgi:hypothetical protein